MHKVDLDHGLEQGALIFCDALNRGKTKYRLEHCYHATAHGSKVKRMLARLHHKNFRLARVHLHQFLVQIHTKVLVAYDSHPLCLFCVALHRLHDSIVDLANLILGGLARRGRSIEAQ